MDALCAELELKVTSPPPTVFVGGGTPTYLPLESIERLMLQLKRLGVFASPNLEFTIEANPESCSLEKLGCFAQHGANRISIGAQSFSPDYLKLFDRVHSSLQIGEAVRNARAAGFRRLNLDLIFAKPDESLAQWESDLSQALALNPDHLSCYELAFEEGTSLLRDLKTGKVHLHEQEHRAEFYHFTIQRLLDANFDHYEVSAFARPGEECRHNLVYWTSGDWIGVGAGAGSSLGSRKFLNVKSPEGYVQAMRTNRDAVDAATVEEVNARVRLAEVLMMGLRLRSGIPLEVIRERSGLDPRESHPRVFSKFTESGHLELQDGWLRLSPAGRDVADSILSEFL